MDAVTTDPFSPKETPFASEKVTALRSLLVVPALRLNAYDAVTVCSPAIPNVMLLLFEKMTVPVATDWVPAEIATPPPLAPVT